MFAGSAVGGSCVDAPRSSVRLRRDARSARSVVVFPTTPPSSLDGLLLRVRMLLDDVRRPTALLCFCTFVLHVTLTHVFGLRWMLCSQTLVRILI